jgi:serine/threonine protein kinase
VQNMLTLDQIIRDEWGEEHVQFKSLIKSMLKVDPLKRPSPADCLSHPFFSFHAHDKGLRQSKSTEKTSVSLHEPHNF